MNRVKKEIKKKMERFMLERCLYSPEDFKKATIKYEEYLINKYSPKWEDKIENRSRRNLKSYLKWNLTK